MSCVKVNRNNVIYYIDVVDEVAIDKNSTKIRIICIIINILENMCASIFNQFSIMK